MYRVQTLKLIVINSEELEGVTIYLGSLEKEENSRYLEMSVVSNSFISKTDIFGIAGLTFEIYVEE